MISLSGFPMFHLSRKPAISCAQSQGDSCLLIPHIFFPPTTMAPRAPDSSDSDSDQDRPAAPPAKPARECVGRRNEIDSDMAKNGLQLQPSHTLIQASVHIFMQERLHTVDDRVLCLSLVSVLSLQSSPFPSYPPL
jgi:hypothetical protein